MRFYGDATGCTNGAVVQPAHREGVPPVELRTREPEHLDNDPELERAQPIVGQHNDSVRRAALTFL